MSLATALAALAVVCSAAVGILHFVAPRTRSQVDDKILALLEEILPHLPQGSPVADRVIQVLAPA